jgi:aspartate aminotransferase
VDGDAPRVLLSVRVADTLLGAKESWTRRMFELATQLRADGRGPVFDLSLGNPSLEPPACWSKAVTSVLGGEPPGQHRYMTNAGFPHVRAFIAEREARRFELPFDTRDVTMTVGAAGALNVLMRAMLDAGDEVLVPKPYFTEYDHYCDNVGARLVKVATTAEFALDAEALAAAVGPRTRMILLNSPNNPTGAVYDDAQLAALAERLAQVSSPTRPIFVVEDNPYRDLVHDGSSAPSMLTHWPHTIHVTSHSKDLGLAGERIGYIVVSPRAMGRDVLSRAFAFCTRVLGFVNAPALMQRVLPHVLGRADGKVDVGVYARHCRVFAAGLVELGFVVPPPRAGFFLFPGLPAAMRDAEGGDVALTERLLAERTIVVPGVAFGGPGHIRLSLAVDEDTIEGALAAFRKVCR